MDERRPYYIFTYLPLPHTKFYSYNHDPYMAYNNLRILIIGSSSSEPLPNHRKAIVREYLNTHEIDASCLGNYADIRLGKDPHWRIECSNESLDRLEYQKMIARLVTNEVEPGCVLNTKVFLQRRPKRPAPPKLLVDLAQRNSPFIRHFTAKERTLPVIQPTRLL